VYRISFDHRLWVFRSIYYNPKIAYRSGHLLIEISLRNEEMNDYLSLLLQGYAAKRELAALFQSELSNREIPTFDEQRILMTH
jgi:hypothetical protein